MEQQRDPLSSAQQETHGNIYRSFVLTSTNITLSRGVWCSGGGCHMSFRPALLITRLLRPDLKFAKNR
eukprot:4523404-Pyramimonas_sp.AAC.2